MTVKNFKNVQYVQGFVWKNTPLWLRSNSCPHVPIQANPSNFHWLPQSLHTFETHSWSFTGHLILICSSRPAKIIFLERIAFVLKARFVTWSQHCIVFSLRKYNLLALLHCQSQTKQLRPLFQYFLTTCVQYTYIWCEHRSQQRQSYLKHLCPHRKMNISSIRFYKNNNLFPSVSTSSQRHSLINSIKLELTECIKQFSLYTPSPCALMCRPLNYQC